MRVYELAYCCRLYEQLTDYDLSLKRVRDATDGVVDLTRSVHRDAVLKWLREWGCRQFALQDHKMSSESLREWASEWEPRLPATTEHLAEFGESELQRARDAYAALWVKPASYARGGQRDYLKTVGPVGAAKTMYILRPLAFPPWDRKIFGSLGYATGAPHEYGEYLRSVKADLIEVANEAGVSVEQLPELVGRPEQSPVKLVDEFNWVAVTNGCVPPSVDDLSKWYGWARDAKHKG